MYQFKKINDDEYVLISNNKEFPFKRTVDIAKEMQSIDMITTVKVAEFLAERGETYDNTKLRVERIEGNNTIIDESNLRMIEKKAKDIATTEVLNKVYKRLFNKSIAEMLKELDITDKTEEIKNFSAELTKVLIYGIDDNTPRGEDTQGNREGN